MAHFALSYVLRYGGMLQEAAHECDTALSLDPGNYQFRSCGFLFDLMGNTERGMDFLRLDPSSTWARVNMPLHLARAGKMEEARESTKQLVTDYPEDKVISACLNRPSSTESDREVRAAAPVFLADPDPENRYWTGAVVTMCGKTTSRCAY